MFSDESQRTTERRWVERLPKQVPAGLRRSGNTKKSAVLADISTDGCNLKEVLNLRAGERVWVGLPGLEAQQAQVRWTGLGTAGILFDKPLYDAVVARIVNG